MTNCLVELSGLGGDNNLGPPDFAGLCKRMAERGIGEELIYILQCRDARGSCSLEFRSVSNQIGSSRTSENALADADFLHVEVENVALSV